MDRILAFSEELALLPAGGLILCALSGGRDSVALLHFLKTHGFSVAAAHFDHNLRPTSAADADFCQKLCGEWGVPFYRGEGEVGRLPGNTEANARAARYAFLEETAAQCGAQVIATAHNADDNLETVLLHLTRGCGLNGLTGIRPRRGNIVRPLLKTPRSAIDAYVEEFRLPFVEDATNADPRFSRNRIRHQVLPVLKTINPKVTEVVGQMTGYLREDYQFLEEHRPRPEAPGTYQSIPLTPVQPGVDVFGTIWTLSTQIVTVPEAGWTDPDGFWTRPDCFCLALPAALYLRSRQPGDFLHPPFRTGKTVKKWFNEQKVPKHHRSATPVLTDGEHVLSVAGIGPNEEFLAHPGQKGLYVQWTKRERSEQNEVG